MATGNVMLWVWLQDDITGDGTTSNVLIIGELLKQADLYISEVRSLYLAGVQITFTLNPVLIRYTSVTLITC